MGNNFARLLPVLNDAPIVIPIRHEFCGATRFEHAYRRVLEGRINAATFNSRIDEINFITSDHAPSRFLALLPPLAAIVYLILYIIVLAERIGMENYEIHPALTIIFMPFAVAMVQLLAWLWSNHQSEKLFTKIESQLQINNRKDNAKGVLWRLHRELPMDHFDNCSRVLCWSCYFPKLYCGIVLEFIPPAMSNNQQPLAMQPVMTYAQGLQPNASTTIQPPLQTHSHHSSQIGAGTRPQSFMPTPNHQHQQSGSGSGSGPSQPQFAKPASPQPVFSPSQKVDDTNYFQNMQFPQPQHFSPNQSQAVAAPSAPPAQSGGLYPFEALGVSGSGYAAQTAQEAPPVYKEKWQASQ